MSVHTFLGHYAIGIRPFVEQFFGNGIGKGTVKYHELIHHAYREFKYTHLRKLRLNNYSKVLQLLFWYITLIGLILCECALALFIAALTTQSENYMMGWGIAAITFSMVLTLWCYFSCMKPIQRIYSQLRHRKAEINTLQYQTFSDEDISQIGQICYLWYIEATDSTFSYKKEFQELFEESQQEKQVARTP